MLLYTIFAHDPFEWYSILNEFLLLSSPMNFSIGQKLSFTERNKLVLACQEYNEDTVINNLFWFEEYRWILKQWIKLVGDIVGLL